MMPAPLGTPPPPPPDEDCLYLSITRPDGPLPPDGLPVLVWIHGGGYATGSSALDTDGVALARHGLVVVSVAYRLGAFGFLHLGDLLGQPFAGSGAAGLADQLHALRWVRDNISAFGGNPRRVTVYGISAGAKSVANILSHPGSRGLVHRAISASGGGEHVATVEQAGQVTTRFLAALGLRADTADRVTSVPAAEMLARAGEDQQLGARPLALATGCRRVDPGGHSDQRHRARGRGRDTAAGREQRARSRDLRVVRSRGRGAGAAGAARAVRHGRRRGDSRRLCRRAGRLGGRCRGDERRTLRSADEPVGRGTIALRRRLAVPVRRDRARDHVATVRRPRDGPGRRLVRAPVGGQNRSAFVCSARRSTPRSAPSPAAAIRRHRRCPTGPGTRRSNATR